jgi:hypothetical protein
MTRLSNGFLAFANVAVAAIFLIAGASSILGGVA